MLSSRACGSAGCPGESNIHTPAAILQFRPIVIFFPTVKEHPWPMPVPLPMFKVGFSVYRAAKVKLHFPSMITSSPMMRRLDPVPSE
jgi:hypothetical protein